MHEYVCRTCHSLFENSIRQYRCTTLKCQSRHIKEIYVPHKDITYSNFENTMIDEGQKNELYRDRQGRDIRNVQAAWHEKELNDKIDTE